MVNVHNSRSSNVDIHSTQSTHENCRIDPGCHEAQSGVDDDEVVARLVELELNHIFCVFNLCEEEIFSNKDFGQAGVSTWA